MYDFERIPEDERFYFLVQGGDYDPWEDQAAPLSPALGIDEEQIEEIKARDKRMKEIGYSPGSLDPPWWSDCEGRAVHEYRGREISVPTLYTTREAAEEARRAIEENDPEAYLDLVERYGEDGANRAYTNFAPLRVLWTDRESLIAALDAAAFPALLVDGEFRLRHALLGELLAEEEG